MKRQSKGFQSGFTLFEIILVITIIGIFLAATNFASWKPKTSQEKVLRIKNGVSDYLRRDILDSNMGKMPMRNGKIATTTIISLSTGSITSRYLDKWGAVIHSGRLTWPYYDGDKEYVIKSISWTGGTTPGTVGTGSVDLVLQGNTISLSGASDTSNVFLNIIVGYYTFTGGIEIDRRTGKITRTGIE